MLKYNTKNKKCPASFPPPTEEARSKRHCTIFTVLQKYSFVLQTSEFCRFINTICLNSIMRCVRINCLANGESVIESIRDIYCRLKSCLVIFLTRIRTDIHWQYTLVNDLTEIYVCTHTNTNKQVKRKP